MGHQARGLTLTGLALCLAACGDPLVVTGDAPGVMRIVVGAPEQSGDSLGETATESYLNEPGGLAVDAEGNLYVADELNSRVLRVTPAGKVRILLDHSARSNEPRVEAPAGLDLGGADDLLYVADPVGGRVWRIDLESGDALPIAGTGGTPSTDTTLARQTNLLQPTGVAAATDGSVYVTERAGHRIRRIDPAGGIATIAGDGSPGQAGDDGPALAARLNGPAGIDLAGGILYVADSGNQRVRAVVLDSGIIASVAGAGGPGFAGDGGSALVALLNEPVAVSVTIDLRVLFVADAANHRVRQVRLDSGIISTFAGDGTEEFSGDLRSAGITALSAPQGLVVTPFNLLFVSDTGHHIVYRTALGVLAAP